MLYVTQLPNIFGVNLIGTYRIVGEEGGTSYFLMGDFSEVHDSRGLLLVTSKITKSRWFEVYKTSIGYFR